MSDRARASARLGDRSWIDYSGTTPGPWETTETADGFRITSGGAYVARVHLEKDAALVAMAPELRCLCASMYARLTSGCFSHLQFQDKQRWIDMLADTLRRAGMEPPPYTVPIGNGTDRRQGRPRTGEGGGMTAFEGSR